MSQRQSITAESIFGDDFDADIATSGSSDVDSPSDGQSSNPECESQIVRYDINSKIDWVLSDLFVRERNVDHFFFNYFIASSS